MRVGFIMRAHPRHDTDCLVSGAVKNPYRLLRALNARVQVVGVVTEEARARFDGGGYPVVSRQVPGARLYVRTLLWNLVAFPAVVRLYRRADIVQCHHPHLGLGAALLRRSGRPVALVVKAHGTAVPELVANRYGGARGALLRLNAAAHLRHDRWVLRSADRCVVSSDFQRQEMVDLYGVDPARLVRAYNGIDSAYVVRRTRAGADAVAGPRFVFVGRVVPKKGYRQLAALYRGLRARFPDATLDLVLGHHDRVEDPTTLRLVAEELTTQPGCRVHHDLDEPALFELLAGSDVGLVPSEGYESIPTVVLEMASTGLPVFATYRWGIPEVLPEEFGLGGDVEADVARIVSFVENELATWDSAAWARRFEPFHYDRLAGQYLDLYGELLSDAGA